MGQLKKIKIISVTSKIISGSFGNSKYFGYAKNKLISLVEIKTNYKNIYSYGESLIGTYSPDLYVQNLNYIKIFFLGKTPNEGIKIIQQLQNNKFFYYNGVLKSVLASIEISLLNLIAISRNESLGKTLNRIYFNSKSRENNFVKVYSSAGSIKSNLNDIRNDLTKSKSIGFKHIKIRVDLSKNYKSKIELIKKYNFDFAVDLIANTFERNRNLQNLKKFLNYMKNNKPLWIEEVVNVNDVDFFNKIKKNYKTIKFSYGENFNSFFDFYNLTNYHRFDYINVDISHTPISDLFKLINFIKKNKIKSKIIFHCWGGIVNLQTSLEIASLSNANIEMVEIPMADFSLNNKFIKNLKIDNSCIDLNSLDRKNINKYHESDLVKNKIGKLNKYEFKFKK